MTKAQFRVLMLLTVISGLVGGGLSDLLFRIRPARAAQATTAPKVIEAQEFRLVDEEGKRRALLSLEPSGSPILALFDAAGKPRASLAVIEGSPSLALFDAAGKPRASLALIQDDAGLALWDATGQVRARLDIRPDGRPGLNLSDAAGKIRASIAVLEGSPGLNLFDAAGKPRASLALIEGSAGLNLFDAAGKIRARLDLLDDGRPGLGLCDAAGNARAVVGCTATVFRVSGVETEHAESTITLFNDSNEVLWQAP